MSKAGDNKASPSATLQPDKQSFAGRLRGAASFLASNYKDLSADEAQALIRSLESAADHVEAYFASVHSENKALDIEAIAWAYRKLQTFGVHTGTVDSALMMDRLNLILQEQR